MDYMHRAEALLERLLGYKMRVQQYTDVLTYGDRGARIKNDRVIDIISVRAKASNWEFSNYFGATAWIDIELKHIITHAQEESLYVFLPAQAFSSTYSEVEVTYVSGYEDMPEDIIDALREIESLLRNGTITEWNCILPSSVYDVIEKYRKGEID